jgi:hypothetical protein
MVLVPPRLSMFLDEWMRFMELITNMTLPKDAEHRINSEIEYRQVLTR